VPAVHHVRDFLSSSCANNYRANADCIHGEQFKNDVHLCGTVARYIAHYDRRRLHSALGYRSRFDYERSAA
jgi:hypothetical protein